MPKFAHFYRSPTLRRTPGSPALHVSGIPVAARTRACGGRVAIDDSDKVSHIYGSYQLSDADTDASASTGNS